MEKNIFGDRQPWGEYAGIWLRDWTEEQAYPKGVGENNLFLSTYSGTCVKDYVKTGSKVLKAIDLGCNYGGMVYHFLSAGLEYTGVDQSDVAIELAKKKFPDLKFITCLLWDLDIKEEYDIAYMQAVLQHNLWAEQERIIPKIFNLLKPGGVFHFLEGTVTPEHEGEIMNPRTNRGWIDLMTRNGFVYEKSWYYNAEKIPNIYLFTKPLRS